MKSLRIHFPCFSLMKENTGVSQSKCCCWDSPISALSCLVTATSRECQQEDFRPYPWLQLSPFPPFASCLPAAGKVHAGPVVPSAPTENSKTLSPGSAGSHAPLEAKHDLKVVLQSCRGMPTQQAVAALRRTWTASCPPWCPGPPQAGGWGQREGAVSYGARPIPLSSTARR